MVRPGGGTEIATQDGPSDATPSARDDRALVLSAAGLAYLGLGAVLGLAYLAGVHSSLFPTGWVLPLVLVVTGALMTARRRADVVLTLWASLALAVFMLDVLIYASRLDQGIDDPAAFDASIIVAALGLLSLLLRPLFRPPGS